VKIAINLHEPEMPYEAFHQNAQGLEQESAYQSRSCRIGRLAGIEQVSELNFQALEFFAEI
jgi:hypothetical protein